MKSLIRILTVVAGIAVVAILAAPMSDAACPTPGTASHWNLATSTYAYINGAAPGTNSSTLVAHWWQNNNRAAGNEGSLDDSSWLLPFGDQWYMDANLAGAGTVGCPDGNLVLVIQNNVGDRSQVLVQTVAENPACPGGVCYDFSLEGNVSFVDAPRPKLSNRQVAGNLRNFSLNIDPLALPASGAGEVAFQVRTLSTTATNDAGRTAAAYPTAGPTVTPGTPTQVSFDCTNTSTEHYVVTQLIIDGQPSDLVSASTRVTCNPALADPKFKEIQRPQRRNR